MTEIKFAICAGRNLDDRLWLKAVNSGFDERTMNAMGQNNSNGSLMIGESSMNVD